MNSRKALISAFVEIEVPFHDCDPMNVVWHGSYARYLEVARCELLRKFNYDYLEMNDSGYMWPIVDMRLKYISSATFRQLIRVDAYLKEYESCLKIDYVITDAKTGDKLSKASTTQVAVDIASKEMQYASPQVLLDLVQGVLA
ncbi:MAG: acyl-CoA thioesterase [Thalassotalea sp.]